MGRASVPTPAVYPAFFFVLEKGSKSAGNAVIPTFPMHRSYGFQHLRHKRPRSLSRVKVGTHIRLSEKDRTQGLTRRNTGVSDGALSLPSTRTARSRTSPGRGLKRQTLPLLGLGRGYSRRTQRASGTAMRLCASLSRGVAAPLGCVICLQLGDVAVFSLCAQGLSVCARRGVVSLPSARFTCC